MMISDIAHEFLSTRGYQLENNAHHHQSENNAHLQDWVAANQEKMHTTTNLFALGYHALSTKSYPQATVNQKIMRNTTHS
jgi:hypothetical protein